MIVSLSWGNRKIDMEVPARDLATMELQSFIHRHLYPPVGTMLSEARALGIPGESPKYPDMAPNLDIPPYGRVELGKALEGLRSFRMEKSWDGDYVMGGLKTGITIKAPWPILLAIIEALPPPPKSNEE